MKFQNVLIGLGIGTACGYAAIRALAWRADALPEATASPNAAAYGKARRGLEAAALVRSTVSSLAFAYGPPTRLARDLARPLPTWLQPCAVAVTVGAIGALVDLPTSVMEDFALERQYSLGNQTQRDYLIDYAKSAAIGIGIAAVLAGGAGWAMRAFPRRWPVIASIACFPLAVVAQLLVPLYIMPLFNRFEPLTGPLETRLRALAAQYGVGDAEILRMNMSRQTKKANAFVTGLGKTHRIVLGDTLVDNFTIGEVEFVVAHELGHYVTKDTWRFIGVAQIASTVAIALAAFLTQRDAEDVSVRLTRVAAIVGSVFALTRPALLALSRSREWAADRFALETTRDPRTGAAAFARLREQNLAEDDVPDWYALWFSSHPSLGARIAALEASA